MAKKTKAKNKTGKSKRAVSQKNSKKLKKSNFKKLKSVSKKNREPKTIGVVDTMFSRANMGGLCVKTIKKSGFPVRVVRKTVPGIKDLGVAAKKLIQENGCGIVVTLGMAGSAPIDKTCAHEAVQGIQWAQLLTNTHIIDIMVFEEEGKGSDEKLAAIMGDRIIKHTHNALAMLFEPKTLVSKAGTAQRQGSANNFSIILAEKTMEETK